MIYWIIVIVFAAVNIILGYALCRTSSIGEQDAKRREAEFRGKA